MNNTLMGMEVALMILKAIKRESAEKMSKSLEEALKDGDNNGD